MTISRIGTFIIVLLILLSLSPLAYADEVYKWKDKSGTIHFSTSPKSSEAQVAKLPIITRENLSQRIQSIKDNTPQNCSKHGGIDCSAGRDKDGSVICVDGFTSSKEPFSFSCLEARLQLKEITFTSKDNKIISYSSKLTPKGHKDLQSLTITIRNKSAVQARDISVSIPWKYKHKIQIDGPRLIDGFGVGEYSLVFNRDITPDQILSILKERSPSITCKNCR